MQGSFHGANYFFFILSEGPGILALLWGNKVSPTVAVGTIGSLCTVVRRPPGTSRVAGCHSVEELGFSSWTGEMWLFCTKFQHEVLGFCVLWGTGLLVLPAEWQVIAFLSSVCNLVFLLFGRGARALLLSRTLWSAEPPFSANSGG
jgi:hypothetical protein